MTVNKHIAARGPQSHKWRGGTTRIHGMLYRYMPGHPRSTIGGYVAEHYLVMERKLGRPVAKEERIVFEDGDPSNIDESNLTLMANNSEMRKYVALKMGMYSVKCACATCGKPVIRAKSMVLKGVYCSPECAAQREYPKPSDASRKSLHRLFKHRPKRSMTRRGIKVAPDALFCASCGTCAQHLENRSSGGTYCNVCDSLVDVIRYGDSTVVLGMKIKQHTANCEGFVSPTS